MTRVKAPGGPTSPLAPGEVEGIGSVAPTKSAEVSSTSATTATAKADPSAAVLADLRAGAITPDMAVTRLTDAALQKAQLPESLRPVIAEKLRTFLATDPSVASLLGRMGASVPTDE